MVGGRREGDPQPFTILILAITGVNTSASINPGNA